MVHTSIDDTVKYKTFRSVKFHTLTQQKLILAILSYSTDVRRWIFKYLEYPKKLRKYLGYIKDVDISAYSTSIYIIV